MFAHTCRDETLFIQRLDSEQFSKTGKEEIRCKDKAGPNKGGKNKIKKRETETNGGRVRGASREEEREESVMRSESPQVKTRPGLRISTRTHQGHYAITSTHLLPSFQRYLRPFPIPLAIYLLNRSKF